MTDLKTLIILLAFSPGRPVAPWSILISDFFPPQSQKTMTYPNSPIKRPIMASFMIPFPDSVCAGFAPQKIIWYPHHITIRVAPAAINIVIRGIKLFIRLVILLIHSPLDSAIFVFLFKEGKNSLTLIIKFSFDISFQFASWLKSPAYTGVYAMRNIQDVAMRVRIFFIYLYNGIFSCQLQKKLQKNVFFYTLNILI